MHLADLPDEVLYHVLFPLLHMRLVFHLAQCSSRFRHLITSQKSRHHLLLRTSTDELFPTLVPRNLFTSFVIYMMHVQSLPVIPEKERIKRSVYGVSWTSEEHAPADRALHIGRRMQILWMAGRDFLRKPARRWRRSTTEPGDCQLLLFFNVVRAMYAGYFRILMRQVALLDMSNPHGYWVRSAGATKPRKSWMVNHCSFQDVCTWISQQTEEGPWHGSSAVILPCFSRFQIFHQHTLVEATREALDMACSDVDVEYLYDETYWEVLRADELETLEILDGGLRLSRNHLPRYPHDYGWLEYPPRLID